MAWSANSPNRIRGRRWMKIRAYILARDPLCVRCLKHGRIRDSAICDHVISLAEGGTNDDDNLQGLCGDCSDEKTEEERLRALGKTPKQRIGLDGWPIS